MYKEDIKRQKAYDTQKQAEEKRFRKDQAKELKNQEKVSKRKTQQQEMSDARMESKEDVLSDIASEGKASSLGKRSRVSSTEEQRREEQNDTLLYPSNSIMKQQLQGTAGFDVAQLFGVETADLKRYWTSHCRFMFC